MTSSKQVAAATGCAHSHGRAASAGGVLETVEDKCRKAGLRLTPIRRNVLEALLSTHKPLGAYDIIESMGRNSAKRLAPITIYRALEFLQDNGFVHRLETRNAFMACSHGHSATDLVVFMICEDCGGIDEADGGSVTQSLDLLVARAGFVPHKRVVEMSGVCEHCREP
jgi:Fur family transcriptional regulator, zinc uptake regulator